MPPPQLTVPVQRLSLDRPMHWLAEGWHDLWRAPLPGLLHGAAFVVAGGVITTLGWRRSDLLAGAFSGFLLVAPILSAGLYEVSRRLARGERPVLRDVLSIWADGGAPLVRLGLLLAVLGVAWVALSSLLVAAMAPGAGADGGVVAFVVALVLSPDWRPFALWLVTGGVLAAVVFAIAAVSPPMLLDRETGVRIAVLASARAVGANPVTMALWAALVMSLTFFALVTVLPLVIIAPVLGHATWHAYADAIDAGALPPRV